MKLVHSFEQFLRNEVNLDQMRIDRANGAFDTLTSFLKNHQITKNHFLNTSKQGSLRQGTIIKPRKGATEFDVDILFRMKIVEGWPSTKYLDTVHDAFKSSDRYKDLVDRRGKNRCVTIDYVDDFHVDIVPAIEYSSQTFIMNRKTSGYEITDGDGYANWFAGRNQITGGANLVRTVRLLKYLRDEHDWPVKSILLTTLISRHVFDTDQSHNYADVPTSLTTLMTRLDQWMQNQKTIPIVSNPALPSENFNRHWDQKAFTQFKDLFHDATELATAAFYESDLEQSVTFWRKLFGDNFPVREEDIEKNNSFLAAAPGLGVTAHARPLTDIARGEDLKYRAKIDAWSYDKRGKVRFRGINSDVRLPSGCSIKFKAWTDACEPYDVRWQVVNTGEHATKENGLRGEYFAGRDLEKRPTPQLQNWELTQYTGRHWIECFIIKDGICTGRSGKFYVNIKNPMFNY